MHSENTIKQQCRHKRAIRVRRRVRGTRLKPRMSVHRSNQHIGVQLIDDEAGVTLASVSTLDKGMKGTDHGRKSKQGAQVVGAAIAAKARDLDIQTVVFDRGAYKYHGLIATMADAAREGGIQF